MGFSEEEVNELKEQFNLFDMVGEGKSYRYGVHHTGYGMVREAYCLPFAIYRGNDAAFFVQWSLIAIGRRLSGLPVVGRKKTKKAHGRKEIRSDDPCCNAGPSFLAVHLLYDSHWLVACFALFFNFGHSQETFLPVISVLWFDHWTSAPAKPSSRIFWKRWGIYWPCLI